MEPACCRVEAAIGIQAGPNRNGAPIDNATNASYTVTEEDVDQQISITATYTDEQGTSESVTVTVGAGVAVATCDTNRGDRHRAASHQWARR